MMKTVKLKTSELKGAALDWAVAKCLPDDTVRIYFEEETGEKLFLDDWEVPEFSPSIDWAQGGPIIERERIGIATWGDGDLYWEAECGWAWAKAPTPLIAAMRCYATFKLGDEVEVPEELKGVTA